MHEMMELPKYHKEVATWAKANSTCRSEGSLLFHPDTAEELELVLRVLEVGPNYDYGTHIGMSDLDEFKVYKTVDGRPISEVYDKWRSGDPVSTNDNRCGGIVVDSRELYVYSCYWSRRYVCKHQPVEAVMTTAIEGVKTVIGTASDRLNSALERLTANQSSVIERLAQSIDRLSETIQRQATDQVAALNRIAEDNAKQAAAMDRQSEAIQRLPVSQTSAIERQTLVLEKLLSSWQENKEELEGWLEERSNIVNTNRELKDNK